MIKTGGTVSFQHQRFCPTSPHTGCHAINRRTQRGRRRRYLPDGSERPAVVPFGRLPELVHGEDARLAADVHAVFRGAAAAATAGTAATASVSVSAAAAAAGKSLRDNGKIRGAIYRALNIVCATMST